MPDSGRVGRKAWVSVQVAADDQCPGVRGGSPQRGIVTLVSVGDLEGSVGVRTATASYKGHRYPVEIIGHCVWLYFRFSLSFREVEELMLARGVVVSYETIRRWCAKFGQAYANQLRRRRPRPGDKWH